MTAGERCAHSKYGSSIVVSSTSRGNVVGVHKILPVFIHESHPGMVLLLDQQKCTVVYCYVQPIRAAAGERRRESHGCLSYFLCVLV